MPARSALDLDFGRRRPRWPAWLLLAAGVAALGEALFGWQALRDEVAAIEHRQTRRTVPLPRAPVSEAAQRELDAARQVLQELALPWEPLFRSIEAAVDDDTALLSLEPDASKRVVRIGGEARDILAAIAFVQRLESTPALDGVHLLSHQVRADVAERPVQFVAAATWRHQP
jgi:Tfp pilus assembly protein PilN